MFNCSSLSFCIKSILDNYLLYDEMQVFTIFILYIYIWKGRLCDIKNFVLSTSLWFKMGSLLQECAAAFVFFKTRYAALMAAQLQTSNPMLWVTVPAPEPNDVYWSNLCIPYRQLWIRKIAIHAASLVFMIVFLIPVTFVQGLTQLEKLQKMFPFLNKILKE